MALILGYRWEQIEQFMVTGISRAMPSIMILIVIGILIGVWIVAGVVPTMIYFGLKLLSPEHLSCRGSPHLLHNITRNRNIMGYYGDHGTGSNRNSSRTRHPCRCRRRRCHIRSLFWRQDVTII